MFNNKRWAVTITLLLLTVSFAVMVVDAALEASVLSGLRDLSASAWGRVTLVDLSLGLLFASAWMAVVAGPRRAWPWIVALWALGNLTLLVFLLMRLRHCESPRSLLLGDAGGS